MPDPFGAAGRRGCTAPATWRGGCADGRAGVPRPPRPPGEGARLPHRAGRDRGGAARSTPAVREAVVVAREDAPGDKRLVAYVVLARARREAWRRCAPSLEETAAGVHGAVGLRGAGGAAADAQRQGGPQGAAGAGAAPRPELERAFAAPRTPDGGAAGGHLGARCWALERVGVARQLLRAGRPLAAGHAGRLAHARRASGWSCRCATCSRRPPWRRWRRRRGRGAAAGQRPRAAAAAEARAARRRRCRCPSRSSGCGSSTSWSRAAPSTTSPSAVRLDGRAGRGRAGAELRGDACAGTRRCAPPSAPRTGLAGAGHRAGAGAARWQVVDLSALPEAAREAEAPRLAGEEARRPFDLARGPLLRAALLRLAEQEHVLLLTMHHIVSDGWSMGVLVRELAALYDALRRGPAVAAAGAAASSTRTTRAWQREWLQGEVLEAQLAYWQRAARRGARARWSCPRTGPGRRCRRFRGAQPSGAAAAGAAGGAARRWRQREGATPFMVLLAAFQVLLSPLHGAGGRRASARPSPAARARRLEGLIGFFVNTLVLRARLSADAAPSASCWRQVREAALGAYAHQDVPFEQLVEELQPERDLSRTPLFQVMFVAPERAAAGRWRCPGWRCSALERGDEHVEVRPDALRCRRRPRGCGRRWSTTPTCSTPPTVARLVGHLRVLLEGAVAEPEQRRLARCRCWPTAERQQVLVEWNDTARRRYPRDACAPRAVRGAGGAHAGRRGGGVRGRSAHLRASWTRGRTSWRTTCARWAWARRCAWALCVERSLELVVALLGILKAGGAYVPLDPAYPRGAPGLHAGGRAACAVLVTQRARWRTTLPVARRPRVVRWTRTWAPSPRQPDGNPPRGAVRRRTWPT